MFRPLPQLLRTTAVLALATLPGACRHTIDPSTEVDHTQVLEEQLSTQLSMLGARNWIVIADPTFPVFAGKGVVVQATEASSIEALDTVLGLLDAQGNLKPRIWHSSELEVIPERRAPGIRQYRRELKRQLADRLHYDVTERIISLQLADAAQTYRILFVKTTTPLPYSTVAIELDSGYWDSEAESEIRNRMEKLETPAGLKPLPQLPPQPQA